MITATFIMVVVAMVVSVISLGLVYLMYLRIEEMNEENKGQSDAMLHAAADMAKSAQINRKESTIVQQNTVDRIEDNATKIKEQVENVPHLTAEEVVRQMTTGDSGTLTIPPASGHT